MQANNKQNETNSQRKITHSNNDIWLNNPYIINSNGVLQGKIAENNFNKTNNINDIKNLKTSKNRSIDANIFFNSNAAGNIFSIANNGIGNKLCEFRNK